MKDRITIEEHKVWATFHQTHDVMTKCEEIAAQTGSITNQQLFVIWTIKFISDSTDRPIIITELVPYLNRSIASISAIISRA